MVCNILWLYDRLIQKCDNRSTSLSTFLSKCDKKSRTCKSKGQLSLSLSIETQWPTSIINGDKKST